VTHHSLSAFDCLIKRSINIGICLLSLTCVYLHESHLTKSVTRLYRCHFYRHIHRGEYRLDSSQSSPCSLDSMDLPHLKCLFYFILALKGEELHFTSSHRFFFPLFVSSPSRKIRNSTLPKSHFHSFNSSAPLSYTPNSIPTALDQHPTSSLALLNYLLHKRSATHPF
jgi:hypothetical protein